MWHVYTPQGQQYGPLNKQTLDAWVAEGRIRPDWYLCQAGWSEWKLARDLYPQLGGGGVAVASAARGVAAAPRPGYAQHAQPAHAQDDEDQGESIAQSYSRKAGNPWVFWGGMLGVAGVLAIVVGIFAAQKAYEMSSGSSYRERAYQRYEALGSKSEVRDWVDQYHAECYRNASGGVGQPANFSKYFELMDAKVQAAADPSGETKFRTAKKGKR